MAECSPVLTQVCTQLSRKRILRGSWVESTSANKTYEYVSTQSTLFGKALEGNQGSSFNSQDPSKGARQAHRSLEAPRDMHQ